MVEIDGFKSKWYIEDKAMTAIEANIVARQKFARSMSRENMTRTPQVCELKDLHCDRVIMKASLSQFGYYCPVTWKNTKQLIQCTHNPENSVFYQNLFYYFFDEAERMMFIDNPSRFTNNVIFSSQKGIPKRFKLHKAAEIITITPLEHFFKIRSLGWWCRLV